MWSQIDLCPIQQPPELGQVSTHHALILVCSQVTVSEIKMNNETNVLKIICLG